MRKDWSLKILPYFLATFCLSPLNAFAQAHYACKINQVYINKAGLLVADQAAKKLIDKTAIVQVDAKKTGLTFDLGDVFQKDKVMQLIYPISENRYLLAQYSPSATSPATIFFRLNTETQEFSFTSLGYFPRIITGICSVQH